MCVHSHRVLVISQEGKVVSFLGDLDPREDGTLKGQALTDMALPVQRRDTTVQGTQLKGSRRNTVPGKGLGTLRSQMRQWDLVQEWDCNKWAEASVGLPVLPHHPYLCPEYAPSLHPGWPTISSTGTLDDHHRILPLPSSASTWQPEWSIPRTEDGVPFPEPTSVFLLLL